MAYATRQFELSAPEGEGDQEAPRRVHLESLARQGDPEAIWELENIPPLHPLAAHLWQAFLDLSQTRQSSGFGPSRLSRLEIRQWEADEGQHLDPWERRCLMAIDAEWVRVNSEIETARSKRANR